ncbi:MAG: hypothetical protein COX52_02155 [Syntrophobacterales bacterium CG23_combo_of_CG06-09_8_20_14_all_48_27]|nr:MAG: hypothetical protein COX52_02155 [Syntrophobacterales bacterium CG23_combo_of_CG06-09_8_20_14_all_48_27]
MKDPDKYRVVRFSLIVLASIGIFETIITLAFNALPFSDLIQDIADPILLTIMVGPVLFFFLYRLMIQENARITEAEKRVRKIIETSCDAFIAMDVKGIITEWNRAAETTFGWTRKEALGKSMAKTIIPPSFREAHNKRIRRFLATDEGVLLNTRTEINSLLKNP